MTSKEKCLDLIDDIRCTIGCEYIHASILSEIYKYLDEIEKFINQSSSNPTLSECIKEWEDRGWETIYRENHIIFRHHKTYKVIEIDSINLSYKTDEWYDPERPYADRLNIDEIQYITLDLHNLIHKTIKALEEMKND